MNQDVNETESVVGNNLSDYKHFRKRVRLLLMRMEKEERELSPEDIYSEILKWLPAPPSASKRSILKSEINAVKKEFKRYLRKIDEKARDVVARIVGPSSPYDKRAVEMVTRWFLNGWLSTSEPAKNEAAIRMLTEVTFIYAKHPAKIPKSGNFSFVGKQTGGTDQE